MIASLPSFTDYEAYRPWREAPAQWLPVARDIVDSHGLTCAAPHVFGAGTNIVMALDEKLILKIFPPFLRSQFVSERDSLAQLRGRVRIARKSSPKASATDGPISSSRDCRAFWVRRRGQRCRNRKRSVCSRKSVRPLPKCSAPRSARSLGSSRTGAVSCAGKSLDAAPGHERVGLPQKFLDGFDELLRDAAALIPMDRPPVILTGEYIPENFLLEREIAGWRLSGLIDFGDVMTGWGEYDLLGPSAFMTSGMPRRCEACLRDTDIQAPISIPT